MDALQSITDALQASVQPHADASLPEGQQSGSESITEASPVQEEKKEELMSPRLSAIVKRENMLIKRERELKMREKEMEGKLEGKLSREELMQNLKEEYEEDPYDFMNKYDFSYERLQQRILGGDEGKGLSKLEREISNLKKQLEDKDKKAQEDEEENSSKTLETKKSQAIDFIKSQIQDSEEFELIANEDSYKDVYDVIQEYFVETNKWLSVKEAANLVEKHLEDEFRKRLEYKKVKSWSGSPVPKEDLIKSSQSDQSSPENTFKDTKTITSEMLQSSSGSKSDLELSDEERMQKAIRLMSGKQN